MTVPLKTENKVLMQQAREALKGKWGLAVGTFFIYMLIVTAIQYIPKVGGILSLIISGPMIVGLSIFSLALSRDRNPRFSQIFDGFRKFWVSLGAYLLFLLFVLLWAILLIIPGIIAAYSYAMIFFIIAEDDTIGPLEAIRKSKKMMRGNKWKLFCLYLRFIGWALLCLLSLGIGFLWLAPYMNISFAKFYDDLLDSTDSQAKEEESAFIFE